MFCKMVSMNKRKDFQFEFFLDTENAVIYTKGVQ